MPKGTEVERVYQALLREGKDQGSAARIAQAQTGLSLQTGRKPKRKRQRHPAIVPAGNIDTVGMTKAKAPSGAASRPRLGATIADPGLARQHASRARSAADIINTPRKQPGTRTATTAKPKKPLGFAVPKPPVFTPRSPRTRPATFKPPTVSIPKPSYRTKPATFKPPTAAMTFKQALRKVNSEAVSTSKSTKRLRERLT